MAIYEPDIHLSTVTNEQKTTILSICIRLLQSAKSEEEAAVRIKKELDLHFKNSGSWHVVVGRSYSSSISHIPGYLLYFTVGGFSVLVWSS